jgi:hypothetical protein
MIFGGKKNNIKCVLIFSTTFVSNIFHSKKNRARCDQKCRLVFKYSTRYSFQILMKLKFYRHTSQNIQISNSTKNLPVGAELFHADRRTDMKKLTARFHNFANTPKKLIQQRITLHIAFFKYSLSRQLVPINLQTIVGSKHI